MLQFTILTWIWGTASRHGKPQHTYTDVFFIPMARALGRIVRALRG